MKNINIIIIFLIFLLKADTFMAQENFNFNEKLNCLTIKSDLHIFKKNQSDFFYVPLTRCLPDFYKNMEKCKYYFLRDYENTNAIIVTEYIFDNDSSAKESYDLAYKYAETVRNTFFVNYSDICLIDVQINERVYYASLNGNHVYIFGLDYDFALYGNNSIEILIKSNSNLLIDDLVNQFNK